MLFSPSCMQDHKTFIAVINHTTIQGIQILTDGRIKQIWMFGCCVVTDISLKMLFNSNLKALGSAPYICWITAALKFINQISLLEDRKHILMNKAKCSLISKDGSNHSCFITTCNRGRNLIGNQLARRSKPRKSNVNWAFSNLFLNLLTVLLMVSTTFILLS